MRCVRLLSLENGEGVGRVCRPENACRDAPLGAATSVGTGGGGSPVLGRPKFNKPIFTKFGSVLTSLSKILGGGFAVQNSAKMRKIKMCRVVSDTLVVYSLFFFGEIPPNFKK